MLKKKLTKRAFNKHIKEVNDSVVKVKIPRKTLPDKLLDKYPRHTSKELRIIPQQILRSRGLKIARGYILYFTVPRLGKFRTHASKVTRRKSGTQKEDRRRKKELTIKKQNTREALLW